MNLFKLFPVAVAAFALAACDSSSSSSDDGSSSASTAKSSSSVSAAECALSSDGVKVVLPAGGETFKLGDSVTVVYGAKYSNAGSFDILYYPNSSATGISVVSTSVGPDSPDGTECYTEKVLLSDTLSVSNSAFFRVRAYSKGTVRGDSKTFTVTK